MMKKNLGKIDRLIRFILALILFYVCINFIFRNIFISIVLFLVSLALLFNSITGYCGLYNVLRISTNKKCNVSDEK